MYVCIKLTVLEALKYFTVCHNHFDFAASIISKKVAEGTKTLVMDVKVGSAAFFQSEDKARTLASMLVS
jgi:thymidine phosphorylase